MAKNEPVPSWVLKPEDTAAPPAAPAPAPEPGFLDTVGQYAGVATRALAPYATAAGGGAIAGAPFAGVGAIPGAAGGVLSLGAADLGTAIYNLVTPAFGGKPVPLPSETIRSGYEKVGIGRRPETATQQVFSDIIEGGTAAGGQALSARSLQNLATSPRVRNFMQFLSQNARGQTGAGVAGAAAPSIAANYFNVENPAALFGLSLAGSAAGGKAATPRAKPIPASTLKTQASGLYKQMESEGVNVSPQAMTDLEKAARTKLAGMRYNPTTQSLVSEALNLFSAQSGKPISYGMLEDFRAHIRDLPYSAAGGKRGTDQERAMVKALEETVDDFLRNLTPAQTTAGDAAAANRYLMQARQTRAKTYQTETLENAFAAANKKSSRLDSGKSFARALRDEFSRIAENERKLSRFDKPTQEMIKKVANGQIGQDTLEKIGRMAPSARMFGMQAPFLTVGASHPVTATPSLILGGLELGGMAARGTSSAMTKRAATNALISASGIKPGGKGWNLLAPATQQAILAQERGRTATQRRDKFETPSWVLKK